MLSSSCVGAPGPWRRKTCSQKPGNRKAGGQTQHQTGLGGRARGLAQEGTVCGAGGVPGMAWAVRGHRNEVPVAGAAVQQCRGVSAMQGGSAPSTAAAAAGWAPAQGGHPVRAVSQTGVGGNGKEQCVCSEQGNRSCWRRVWGCLVTVQRGGCCAAVAVRRGWALPGAASGVPALQRSLGRDPVSL